MAFRRGFFALSPADTLGGLCCSIRLVVGRHQVELLVEIQCNEVRKRNIAAGGSLVHICGRDLTASAPLRRSVGNCSKALVSARCIGRTLSNRLDVDVRIFQAKVLRS